MSSFAFVILSTTWVREFMSVKGRGEAIHWSLVDMGGKVLWARTTLWLYVKQSPSILSPSCSLWQLACIFSTFHPYFAP